MAYGNTTLGAMNWFGESAGTVTPNLAASRSSFDVYSDGKSFAERFDELFHHYKTNAGLDIKKDLAAMVADRSFMEQYKTDLLSPIFDGFRAMSPNDPHIESHVENIDRLWDAKVRQYSESASTTAFLPIATLEFPVLTKQFWASITKDIIEVETVKTPNIVKHVKTTYLVDNQTGDMYEYPKCIFEGTWEKIWDAAKGYKFDDTHPLDITGDKGYKLNMINFGIAGPGGEGLALDGPSAGADGKLNLTENQKLSFNIKIMAIDYDDGKGGEFTRLPLRGNGRGTGANGIIPELSTGGTLVGGDINFKAKNASDELVTVEDYISGRVNFQNGTMTVTSGNGFTKAVYVSGYLSNENNINNVSVREVRTLQKFMIEDGPRWNMPFTIEEIEDAAALLDMNYYNRMVDEIVKTQEMIESQTVLKFYRDEFEKYIDADFNIYNLESIVQRTSCNLATPMGYAGNPFEYISDAIQFAIKGAIHKLTDAAKLDKLSFIIIGNPMATQLISKWTSWKMEQGTSIGGIQVNNSYGFATDMGANVRVVASNQIPAYTEKGVTVTDGKIDFGDTGDRELYIRIVGYPTDPEHISFRHLKYTSHLLATPAQAAYMNTNQGPGGAYTVVTATSRYKDIVIQGLQLMIIFENSKRVYGPR